jgi:hypothetical protein
MFPGFVIFSQQTDNTELNNDECYNCHVENEMLPEGFSELDVHLQQGLSCAGCHGGDPTKSDEDESMDPAKGFVGMPDVKDIPKYCGKCHSSIEKMRVYQPRIATDQVAQYYTSVHGKKLKSGDENVATCTSCHAAHSILPASDTRSSVYAANIPETCNTCHGNSELMDQYNIESNQFELYAGSVHGEALLENEDIGAPACNDCHGNHGAMPPGVKSVSHVCGTCHANNMNYFSSSQMGKIFEEMEFHGCEQCHGYHGVLKTTDDMVGTGDNSVCNDCHVEGEAGYTASELIFNHINNLVTLYDSAKAKSSEVKIKGMNDIEIEYKLKDAKQSLIQTRTLVHSFDTTKIREKSQEGVNASLEALNFANKEIEEYFSRRFGFGLATLTLLLLAIALFFKIRSKS